MDTRRFLLERFIRRLGPAAVVGATTAAYVGLFLATYGWVGPMAGAIGLVPAFAAGFTYGVKRGVAASVALIALTNVMRLAFESPGDLLSSQIVVGALSLVVMAAGAGVIKTLMRQLREGMRAATKAQAQLRALIDAIPETLVRVSSEMVVIEAFRPELMAGACRTLPAPGCAVVDWGGAEILEALQPMMADARAGASPSRLVWFGEGAQRRCIEARVRATATGDFLLLFRDMTREKEVEERLLAAERDKALTEAQARVEQSERLASLGTLAAGIAHEINNPLTYVIANLELLHPGAAASPAELADQQDVLESAREGARRIATIVRDMKVLSRQGADLPAEAFNVARAVRASANLARGALTGRAGLQIEMGELPDVQGSESRLAQVFLNLFVNSAQAMPDRSPAQNRIVVRREDAAAGFVTVVVEDNGRGISPETLARVFDPFFTTKAAGVGTGLGLSISRTIVERMGGHLTIASELGKGTRVILSLPTAVSGSA